MFKRLLLTALCGTAMVVGSLATPDSAEARWRWRRPYYRTYYAPPVHYYQPYRTYYRSPNFYRGYRSYYGGPYYYGPSYPRGGVWFRF